MPIKISPVSIACFLLSTALAAVICFSQLTHTPNYDEFYHILAAKSWLQGGTFTILDGTYDRAWLYTLLVALSLQWGGESFELARLPSAISGILMVITLFLWLRKEAGAIPAVLACVLLSLIPAFAYSSGQSRFYTLHAWLVMLAAIAIFRSKPPRKVFGPYSARIVSALVFAALALMLQKTTLVALLALGAWVLWDFRNTLLGLPRVLHLATAVGLIIAFAVGWYSGFLPFVADRLTSSPLWASKNAGNPVFYVTEFGEIFSLLWPALALLLIVTWRQLPPRLVVFNCLFVSVTLVVHSFAAQKSARYVLYVLPFLCALMGLSLAVLLTHARTAAITFFQSLKLTLLDRFAAPISSLLVVLTIAAVIVLDPTYRSNLQYGLNATSNDNISDWQPALADLRAAAANKTIVTSEGVKSAYFLGNFDYELNLSIADETESRGDFGFDRRTGRRAIGTVRGMAMVVGCHQDGIVVIDEKLWRTKHGVTNEVSDYIEHLLQPLAVPAKSRLLAFEWHNPSADFSACQQMVHAADAAAQSVR